MVTLNDFIFQIQLEFLLLHEIWTYQYIIRQ